MVMFILQFVSGPKQQQGLSFVMAMDTKSRTSDLRGDLNQSLRGAHSSNTPSTGPTHVDPLAIRVTIHRIRLLLLSALLLVFVVGLTLSLSHHGIVIETFDRRHVNTTQQEKIVERYNSYSGTLTSLAQRPVEIFMALAVQVIVLRLMADDVLQVERRWRVLMAGLAFGVVATYLLSNGFSAANVQVREQPVHSVISTGELSLPPVDPMTTSTMNKSYSELRPENPVTNTILRNLILPRASETTPMCTAHEEKLPTPDYVDYRIPQRPWMQYLLADGIDRQSMKITISNKVFQRTWRSPQTIFLWMSWSRPN